ncbi:MAG: hypothetical protein ACOYM3_04650 [Terrimicrobiaceae bacterium]
MIAIQISSEAQALATKLGGLPSRVGPAICRTMRLQNQVTIGHIVDTKLANAGPKFLNARSSLLRGSVRASAPRSSGTEISTSIGSNVKYAAVHEYGCGPYTIRPSKGKALRWGNASGVHFARTVRHPGFPARRMFETGIEERAEDYGAAISDTIIEEATK